MSLEPVYFHDDYSRAHRGAPLPPRPLLGFVIAAAAVVFIALLTYRSFQTRSAAAERVTHTLKVLEQLELVLSLVTDAETGQRGYLLTGEDSYLEPYKNATTAIPNAIETTRQLIAGDPVQEHSLSGLEEVVRQKLADVMKTVELRRTSGAPEAIAVVRNNRGKSYMDRIRALVSQMEAVERASLDSRENDWRKAESTTFGVTFGGSLLLLLLIAAAAVTTSRTYRARQTQVWLRSGQMALAARLQGEQRLDVLGDNVLGFLADYLDAHIGALYVAEGGGTYRRVAGYALKPRADLEVVKGGDSLLGQAAKSRRTLHVREVPTDYFQVTSSLGNAGSRELVVVPAIVDGTVQGVLELGFFRALLPPDLELLERVCESLGVAVRASKDRTRLEELLKETQRQSEELQTQQEELRVSNEELEVQSRSLKESQAQLQTQQAELERTNTQLEEQKQLLERQKDELSAAQTVLAQKADDLERANQYKSEFLANMSHELRTPLNSSLILAKILADNRTGNLTAEQVKFAQTISTSGNDLLAIINDILDLSKIEAGKVELAPEHVALTRTLDTLHQAFQPIAQSKGLQLTVSVAAETPERIETDAQRLGQILRNLLSNALKFTERGQVSLQVYAPDPQAIAFAVRDTGIGISESQQEIIFDAFRQADGSTHRRFGGTGLGLTISRDLARLLGGDIRVESRPGEGSVFTLTLPRSYEASSREHPPQPATPQLPATTAPSGNLLRLNDPAPLFTHAPPIISSAVEDDSQRLRADSRLILIIEDDPAFAAILRDVAHEQGFHCVVTHTANEGLAAVELYRPKAILLDMNLPDYSGLGVLDQLKHNPDLRHIPIHVVSVSDYSQEALGMGAVGYALKPVKREELVAALQRLEAKLSQSVRRVLVIEDDEHQRESIRKLLQNGEVQITPARDAAEALAQLRETTFDCVVMDLNLPDASGHELLERMAEENDVSFPPVIIYTGRTLSQDEEQDLRRFSRSIIVKDVHSPERLLDEVTLFLHQVESKLPAESQRMLQAARDRDTALEDRRILVVEDDVRNVFALSSLLEPKGARIEIARNGREAIETLTRSSLPGAQSIDLVLMDIMMPEMDGLTATREIRKRPEWKKLPIIALTAKAMKHDHERCLAAGANDYIAKPLDVEKLLSLVRVWMPK